MRYRAIQEHDRRVPVRLMCRALAVSPAGYYAWAGRPESDRSVRNRALLSAIRVVHRESRETYGSPSIWDALVKRGHGVGEHRIARLMRVEGIRAKTVKQWRATTQSNHRVPVAENTLDHQRAPAPLGSRQPVCRHGVPATADHAWHDRQHVETGELLGQCLRRELLRNTEARTHLPSPVPHTGRGDPGHLRVH